MRTIQIVIEDAGELQRGLASLTEIAPDLVLVFADSAWAEAPGWLAQLRAAVPHAVLAGCSTAGEISPAGVTEKSCVITAMRFARSRVRAARAEVPDMDGSRAAGVALGEQLRAPDLAGILLFGPGLDINGSALVEGLTAALPGEVPVLGGLAGDGTAFRRTWTVLGDALEPRQTVAVGLYGADLRCAVGCFGGWEPFGPLRRITRCRHNVLQELDGEPALAVYKRYLGEYSRDLPASGLLFPFAMMKDERDPAGLIRTILGIDESQGSLILAGEVHEGQYLKLMQASTDRLVDGAEDAALRACAQRGEAGDGSGRGAGSGVALLVSCVGRKLVMGDRVEEEVEAVADALGAGSLLTGFYSYGEIAPFAPEGACSLHNQTMMVGWIGER